MNMIKRLSTDCVYCSRKMMPMNMMYKMIMKGIQGTEPFMMMNKMYGFPMHMYLPRGRVGGMPFKLFVMITPIDDSKMMMIDFPMFGKMLFDGRSFGFPLDRPIMPWFMDLKNIWCRDVYIHYMRDFDMMNHDIHHDMHHGMHHGMHHELMRDDKMMNMYNMKDKFMNHDMMMDHHMM